MIYVFIGLLLGIVLALRTYHFLDGRDFIRDTLDRIRLHIRPLSAWDRFWRNNPERSDIIVCITTTPSRIRKIDGTLKSLLYQSRGPQRIRLHIPRFSQREQCVYEIPDELEGLGALDIVRCEDFGPATKLLPALNVLDDDQKLLVVDDDKLYPPDLVDTFFHRANEHPQTAIASSGWIVPSDLTDRPTTLMSNIRQTPPTPIKSTRIRKPRRIHILQGYSGFLVRPSFFNREKIFDYSGAPQAAFYVDDVWFSAHCNVPKIVFPARRFCFEPWRYGGLYKRTSLGLLNRGGGDPARRSNTIMIRHFRNRWD